MRHNDNERKVHAESFSFLYTHVVFNRIYTRKREKHHCHDNGQLDVLLPAVLPIFTVNLLLTALILDS